MHHNIYKSFLFFHPQDVQAFVAQVEGQIIGVLVIKNEKVIIFAMKNLIYRQFVILTNYRDYNLMLVIILCGIL